MRYVAALTLFLLAVSGVSAYLKGRELGSKPPRAAILDALPQFGVSGFTDECSNVLRSHGYEVDVYRGPEVTVDRLRSLGGYRVVVMRLHSGVFEGGVWLFTGEEFDNARYVLEQLSGEVHLSRNPNDPRLMFAVGSRFVEHHMSARLGGCLVVLMGCDGLAAEDMAAALHGAGAAAVVGWSGPVRLEETDRAALGLLSRIMDGLCLGDAVGLEASGAEGSGMVVYPEEGRSLRLVRPAN